MRCEAWDEAGRALRGVGDNVVRHAADTALNVPYLDAVLFFLGISRREIEAADLDNA